MTNAQTEARAIAERLERAVKQAEEHAGMMPARQAVKLHPNDWHAVCDYAREAATALAANDEELAAALTVLRDHHRWHVEVGEIGLPDDEGGWIGIDLSGEYHDSRLYERTAPLIDLLPAQEKPMPRAGAGSNHWENWVLAVRRLKRAEAQLAEANRKIAEQDKALEPFAKAAYGAPAVEASTRLHSLSHVAIDLTIGHLRAARRAREAQGGENAR